MKHLLTFLVVAAIQNCYHYGAYATSISLAEGKAESAIGEDIDGKATAKSGISAFSASTSSGPGGWTSFFSGPQTGGSVVSFSTLPFSSNGQVHLSKSESTSNGIKQIESHISTLPFDSDDISTQTGSFVSEEDEEIMPSYGRKQSSANGGIRTRLLGLGGSGSSSGLLGLGLLGLL